MREQHGASVDRFLDGLDDRRDEVAAEDEGRRSRRAMPKWEYMTWSVAERRGSGPVTWVNGARQDEEVIPLPRALTQAGEEGWELVRTHSVEDPYVTYVFKRPLTED